MDLRHPFHLIIIITTALFHVVTLAIQAWAMDNYNIAEEWYTVDTTTNVAYFSIQYGPPAWLISMMWAISYIYQSVWLVYALLTLWRKAPGNDEALYFDPYYMPLALYVSVLLGMMFRLSWSALLHQCSSICLAIQLGSAVSYTVALSISMRALVNEAANLYDAGLASDVTLVRALVHNGLAWTATWEWIDLSVNMAGLMVIGDYSQKESYVTMLGILGILLVGYVMTDIPILDLFTRYTITPYLVLALYFIGIIDRHPNSGMVYILAAILLSVVLMGACFKFLIIIVRRRANPEPIPLPVNVQPEQTSTMPTRLPTRMSISGNEAMNMSYIYK